MSDNGKGASRFDLETQYQEFIRVHGFDIRKSGGVTHADHVLTEPYKPYRPDITLLPSKRDTRDPGAIGERIHELRRLNPEIPLHELADFVDNE